MVFLCAGFNYAQQQGLGGDSPTLKHKSLSYELNILYARNVTKKPM